MSRIPPVPAGGAILVATAIALAAVLGAGVRPATAADASVSIADFAFSPANVTVSIGDTVTWTNNDAGVPHTVSSDSGSELASGQLAGGASYQKTFSAAGSYAYHCDIHPSMTALVVVTGTSAETATSTPAATAAATPTATSTTGPTNTPTSAVTASPTGATTPGPTATAPASPTATPRPPATGEGDDNGTATVVASGIVAIAAVLAIGGIVYVVRRRRAQAPGASPPGR